MRGRLIIFEGTEGVGKSTQTRRLAEAMERAGRAPLVVREPGGTEVGEQIRRLLLDPTVEIVPRAEALLFMASRAQLLDHVVAPALAAGRDVLADRFFLSTYAYQIAGRDLPESDVRAANAFATGGLAPDLTLLLTLPPFAGLERAARRGGRDRIERAGDSFHQRVESAFLAFAEPSWQRSHSECGPIVTIDAGGGEDEVAARIASTLADRWPESFGQLLISDRR